MPIPKVPIKDRFWKYVKKTPSCWVWIGRKVYSKPGFGGYGTIKISGSKKFLRAHRVAYELCKGQIPKGLNVLHTCDNPACVNPKHLYLGTQSNNMIDAYQRRRRLPNTKLGPREFRIIAARIKQGISKTQISLELKINRWGIRNAIEKGKVILS